MILFAKSVIAGRKQRIMREVPLATGKREHLGYGCCNFPDSPQKMWNIHKYYSRAALTINRVKGDSTGEISYTEVSFIF